MSDPRTDADLQHEDPRCAAEWARTYDGDRCPGCGVEQDDGGACDRCQDRERAEIAGWWS